MTLRPDLSIISEWISPDSSVLDLGCGDGSLLHFLRRHRNVFGYGLEIDPRNILHCIRSQVNVIQTDLDAGLAEFDNQSFDFVIMTQTLQAIRRPDMLIEEMLRVGREGIVTFPNFGHWKTRLYLGLGGRMPVTRCLPNKWYDTPNIHLCTIKDFELFCQQRKIHIIKRSVVNVDHEVTWATRLFPNLLGEIALYHFKREK